MITAENRLIIWAAGERRSPWAWGITDCAALALRALRVYTDDDRWSSLITWDDECGARKRIGESLPSETLASEGAHSVPLLMAGVGDIIIAPAGEWPEGCHIVLGRHCLTSSPAHGVAMVPYSTLISVDGATAWSAECRKPSR